MVRSKNIERKSSRKRLGVILGEHILDGHIRSIESKIAKTV